MRRILACVAVALVPMVGAAVAQQAKAPLHVLVTAAELKWGEPLAPDDWSQINRLGEYYLDNGHKRRSSRLGGANPEMIEGRDSEGSADRPPRLYGPEGGNKDLPIRHR